MLREGYSLFTRAYSQCPLVFITFAINLVLCKEISEWSKHRKKKERKNLFSHAVKRFNNDAPL